MGEWQSIESAPKDGTEVLVYFETAGQPIVHIAWYDNDEHDLWESQGMGSKEEATGWWAYTENSVGQSKLYEHTEPTHFMPLPNPPEGK